MFETYEKFNKEEYKLGLLIENEENDKYLVV